MWILILSLLCPLLNSIPTTVEGMTRLGASYSAACKAIKEVNLLKAHGLLPQVSEGYRKEHPSPDFQSMYKYIRTVLLGIYVDAIRKDSGEELYKNSPTAYMVMVIDSVIAETKLKQVMDDLTGYCESNKFGYEVKVMTKAQLMTMKVKDLKDLPVILPSRNRTYVVLMEYGKEIDLINKNLAQVLHDNNKQKV